MSSKFCTKWTVLNWYHWLSVTNIYCHSYPQCVSIIFQVHFVYPCIVANYINGSYYRVTLQSLPATYSAKYTNRIIAYISIPSLNDTQGKSKVDFVLSLLLSKYLCPVDLGGLATMGYLFSALNCINSLYDSKLQQQQAVSTLLDFSCILPSYWGMSHSLSFSPSFWLVHPLLTSSQHAIILQCFLD